MKMNDSKEVEPYGNVGEAFKKESGRTSFFTWEKWEIESETMYSEITCRFLSMTMSLVALGTTCV